MGRQGYSLSQIGGFANAFVQAGAGVFVGGLWAVVDEAATVFLRTFYERLKGGDTLAEATIAARHRADEEDPWKSGTHLAYAVYGHPQARLHV
jgi:CHAT domain-containing protein